MNTLRILREYPLAHSSMGEAVPCKYHQAPYIPFHLSVFTPHLTLVVIIYFLILFCFCQWSGISPCLSMSISSNVIRVLPAFTPYTSGVPDKVCDFVGCSYTSHQKITKIGDFICSIQNISLPLQRKQKYTIWQYVKSILMILRFQ